MHGMNSKNSPTRIEGRRKGYGRPIFLELPLDRDEEFEVARARRGLDRAVYARMAVLGSLDREPRRKAS